MKQSTQSTVNKRKVARRFLTADEKLSLEIMVKKRFTPAQISNFLNISYRQARTYVVQYNSRQSNNFTADEDDLLINLYQQGLRKESILAKYIQTKAPWMIRNRIKLLKKQNKLDSKYQIPMEEDFQKFDLSELHIDEIEEPNQYDCLDMAEVSMLFQNEEIQ